MANNNESASSMIIEGSLSVKISDADIARLAEAFGIQPSSIVEEADESDQGK
jgi:hypothetical protein